MSLLHLRLFGGFDCAGATGEALVFPTRKVRALLAYLATNAGQLHGRERLAALLWADVGEAQARANLRKAASRLRQALPEESRACLAADGRGIALWPQEVEVDVAIFERFAADGTPESLERAAALYRGDFLAGFGDCGEEFETWLMAERRRLQELHHASLQHLLEHYVVTGAIDRAIHVALRLLALDPLQESVHRTLIRLYMYQDRVGAALEQYRRCRELLARELEVEPEPETERLKALLLRLLPPDELGDGGTGRETDSLPERARIFEMAAADRARRRAELTGRPSIAVLSFTRAAGEDEFRHLGEGIAEDIATELGRFRELDLIAPGSAFAYRGAGIPPEKAGTELGTAYVLEGTLRPLRNRLRITARLVETATARQLWADRYECARTEVFDMQDEIVRRIVGILVGQIEEARLEATRRKRLEDWEAYDFWLRGWSTLRRADLAAIGEARRYFQQAIARDPNFARAYVGLALAHLNEWACFSWNHWAFLRQEALQLAQKAVELDERDHRAHCMLALTQLYGRDYEAARRCLLRALELNPNDADVLAHVSAGMALLGEHELAVDAGRSALRLAPHHPEWYAAFVGIALFGARLHEEAIETMAPAPEALCNTPAFMAAAYAHLGQPKQGAAYRDTVHRHYRRQLARGEFPHGMSCIDWLLAMDPFRRPADLEHYRDGLRRAGFE